MDDCIFCKIASKEIESTIFYEDDICVAFDDTNPQAPVHSLIVPKKHYQSIADDVPEDVLGHLLSVASKVAEIKGVKESGFRTSANTGDDAYQTVKHLHIHVCGGKKLNPHHA